MKTPLTTDLRAEVWLARQFADSASESANPTVVVRAQGLFTRPYSPDVLTVEDVPGALGQPDTRYVDLSREGFYDMLPEALFHPSRPSTDQPESPTELSKRLRQEEKQGRQFWLPAEQEMMRLRVRIEQQEQQTLAQATGPIWQEVVDWLLSVRGFDLTDQQQICLLAIWMNAHRVVGNWTETAAYFSRFLQVPVHITYGPRRSSLSSSSPAGLPNSTHSPRLGATRVGTDWVLPTTLANYDDGGEVQLAIGPLSAAQLIDYLPDNMGWRHVSLLAGYLLPADADYLIVPIADVASAWFTLAGITTSGRLGMTTTLPPSTPALV